MPRPAERAPRRPRGLIVLCSNAPTDTAEGYLNLEAGEFDADVWAQPYPASSRATR